MSYLPIARKYRPQTFEDLEGQPHVTATLTRALETKRVAQAYLFAGMRGVGKTSAARILAKCLNCEQGPTPTPCHRCTSCTQITQGSSLDVIEIDGASNRGIDEIRALRETIPFAPTSGSFRVTIIDEVHMLTTEAFNALLKTLEEPPAHVKFIFATTAPEKMPATILSRCQRFDFRRVDAKTVVEVLKRIAKAEALKIDDATLFAIARASEGSLRDAEVTLEQLASFVEGPLTEVAVTELLGTLGREEVFGLAQAIIARETTDALMRLRAQMAQGKEPTQLAVALISHLRNLAVVASVGETSAQALTELVDEPKERLAQYQAQARASHPQELVFLLQMLQGAHELMRRSPLPHTILELAIIKMATRETWQSLSELTQRLEQFSTRPPGDSADPEPRRATSGTPAHKTISSQLPLAPASPTPAAPSQSETSEHLTHAWPTFLERLGSKKMSLAAYLAESRPLECAGGRLSVGLPGSALHQEVLTSPEHLRLIEQLLTEVVGQPLKVVFTTLPASEVSLEPAASVPAPRDVPPMVQDIVKMFNATLLEPPTP